MFPLKPSSNLSVVFRFFVLALESLLRLDDLCLLGVVISYSAMIPVIADLCVRTDA